MKQFYSNAVVAVFFVSILIVCAAELQWKKTRGKEITDVYIGQVCTRTHGKGASVGIMRKYGTDLADIIGDSLKRKMWNMSQKLFLLNKNISWGSTCPVNKKPKRRDMPTTGLLVLREYLELIKDQERRIQTSNLFYNCSSELSTLNILTSNYDNPICVLLSTLSFSGKGLYLTLGEHQTRELNVKKVLQLFERFTRCIGQVLHWRDAEMCAKPLFRGCKDKNENKLIRQERKI